MRRNPSVLLPGLAALFAALVARVALGVPLPVDLVFDRFFPFVPVEAFGQSLGAVGGPVLAKQIAFYSSFVILVGFGRTAANRYERVERRRLLILAGATIAAWLLAVAALWPALASNYDGVPPGPARALTVASLAVLFAAGAVALHLTRRDA